MAQRNDSLTELSVVAKNWLLGSGGIGGDRLAGISRFTGDLLRFFGASKFYLYAAPDYRDKIMLGFGGLVILILSYLLLKGASLVLPPIGLVNYGRYLAIALIVTEGIPRLWQRLHPVR